MKKTIILILILTSIKSFSQDLDTAIKLYKKGVISEEQFLGVVNHDKEEIYDMEMDIEMISLAKRYVESEMTMNPEEDLGDIIAKLAGFGSWLNKNEAAKTVIQFFGGLIGLKKCDSVDDFYRDIGKRYVEEKLNPYLVSEGGDEIIED